MFTREQAELIIQSLIISRSSEVSDDSSQKRKEIAQILEKEFPGILKDNYALILLRPG